MPTNSSSEAVLSSAERNRVLWVILTGVFMALVAVSIVNVAMPSIQTSLGASSSGIQWVLSGFALTFGVVLVAAGRAGDMLGRGGIYLLGLTIYTLSSIGAGLAPSVEVLNICRLIMGVGAGLFNPQGMGMIQQYFTGPERGRAFGIFGAVVGLAVAVGPVFGGLLISLGGADLGWRLTMLVNVPFGIIAIVLGLKWFPRPLLSPLRDSAGIPVGAVATAKALDPFGALLLGLVVLGLMFPFVQHQSAWSWGLIPVALVLLAGWVAWEKHASQATTDTTPMVDLAIFKTPSFRNGTTMAAVWFMGATSIWVIVAAYFQLGEGYSALVAGSVGLPGALLSAASSYAAGRAVSHYGRWVVIGGIVVTMAGLASTLLLIVLDAHPLWLIATLTLLGAGQGSVISPNQSLTLQDVPLSYAGAAGAVLQTGQRIGTSVGIAMITGLVFFLAENADWDTAAVGGFAAILGVLFVGLIIAFVDARSPGRAPTPSRA
ncbi:MFS transporter [Corynebacterium uterequi]|uniref:Major Facilitator Superfamily transporter n=1 Tax=Corynebacterium uterequi TaxID=1072256 RepID=A0A0G3HJG8_9CORY|nr:MFS transporter [Corynebacterium uterequi]AKK11252.1 Major Facilitator Superfamily transporter [Corynebacterium uterequi]